MTDLPTAEDADTTSTQAESPSSCFADEPPPAVSSPLPGAPASERRVFLAALAVGISADLLAFRRPTGLGLTIALVATLGVFVVLDGKLGLRLASRNRWPYLVAAALLAISFTIRTSPVLLALDGIAFFLALVMLAVRVRGRRLRDASPIELAIALIEVPINAGVRAVAIFVRRFRPMPVDPLTLDPGASFRTRHGRDIVVGALVAVPVLAVFMSLLVASDAGFAKLVSNLFDWDVANLFQHLASIAFASFLAATATIAVLASDTTSRVEERRGEWAGPATVWIVLGSTAVLFATFLALQGSYLFGGVEYLEERTGLTAAEYARRGFYELLAVSGLTVALLLGARSSFALRAGAASAYRTMTPLLAGLTIVLLGSAMARMWIYADRFGLTEQRIYAVATLTWIACVLAWLGTRVALDRTLQVGAFAGSAAVAVILALNVANPDALSARTNLDRGSDGRASVDVNHLMTLSSDATPAIVVRLDRLPSAQRTRVVESIERRLDERDEDWRSYNLAEARAERALDDADD